MLNKKVFILACALIGMLTGLLIFYSCTKQAPTAPNSTIPLDQLNRSGPTIHNLNISNVTYIGNKKSKEFGRLSLIEADTLQIPIPSYVDIWYVPAGALSSPETCSVQVTQGTNSNKELLIRYDFGPDGLKFNQSTYLTHNTSAADNTPIELWWFNPVTNAWELMKSGVIINHQISFPIVHFSSYTVWEGSSSNGSQ